METNTYVNVMALSNAGAGSGSALVEPNGYTNKTLEEATATARERAMDDYENEIGDRGDIREFVIQVLTVPVFKATEAQEAIAVTIS